MFKFIRYISPVWYYSLNPGSVSLGKESEPSDQDLLDEPADYESAKAVKLDIEYQSWKKGIPASRNTGEIDSGQSKHDEYLFLRRHFGTKWASYVLAVRLLEFNNPFSEIRAYLGSAGTKGALKKEELKDWRPALEEFETNREMPRPKVSVIIPTLNRYDYLMDVLKDLESQDYDNFEVIVVDQSDAFDPDFYKSFELDLTLKRQEEKALWLARNSAIEASTGDLILMTEDDVRFSSDLITKHIRALCFFEADISCGIFYPEGSKVPESRNVYRLADQLATGNAMIRRHVFETVGLFDRQFEKQRSGDGEFGLRSYLAGFRLISNPEATCVDVKAPSGGLRHFGSWDSWRPSGLLSPRPVPSILYLTRKYFGNRAAFYQLCKSFLPSVVPYSLKRNFAAKVLGSLIAIVFLPVLCIPLVRSWIHSSRKLREGALIPELKR